MILSPPSQNRSPSRLSRTVCSLDHDIIIIIVIIREEGEGDGGLDENIVGIKCIRLCSGGCLVALPPSSVPLFIECGWQSKDSSIARGSSCTKLSPLSTRRVVVLTLSHRHEQAKRCLPFPFYLPRRLPMGGQRGTEGFDGWCWGIKTTSIRIKWDEVLFLLALR